MLLLSGQSVIHRNRTCIFLNNVCTLGVRVKLNNLSANLLHSVIQISSLDSD